MEQLPTNLKNEMVRLSGIKHSDVEEVLTKLAREKNCTDLIKQGRNIIIQIINIFLAMVHCT